MTWGPGHWRWGVLSEEELADADDYGDALERRAARVPHREHHLTPQGARYAGAVRSTEGQFAFRLMTGRGIPERQAFLNEWRAPDVDRYRIKTVTRLSDERWGAMLVEDDFHDAGVEAIVLMLNARPQFAIVGVLPVATCLELREAVDWLPGGWVVRHGHFQAWPEPVRAIARCPHGMPADYRCFTCEALRLELFRRGPAPPPEPPFVFDPGNAFGQREGWRFDADRGEYVRP